MKLYVLLATSLVALALFVFLITHGEHYLHFPRHSNYFRFLFALCTSLPAGVSWTNFEVILLSFTTMVLIASLAGLIIGSIRSYCWATPFSTNPTPMTLYADPPPIGSAEAEFQNEYIPVFPMNHLQPRVDLDQK